MSPSNLQFVRKASLVLVGAGNDSADTAVPGIDLSELRFRFVVQQADVQSPNNARIRVYNLSDDTSRQVQGEFSRVILSAGYESSYGVIFSGEIKQFYRGREDAKNSFLDILAADGDLGYNFGVCNSTLAAGSTPADRIRAAAQAMDLNPPKDMNFTGGVLPRGKVLFGMARDALRCQANSVGATWSIQGGSVQVIPLDGYLNGEAIVLSSLTGLVGIPEQTDNGIKARCLLNPKLRVGGRVQIDNKNINQLIQRNPNSAPIPFNQWTGLQLLARVTDDGVYRLYVVEHSGDTRGQEWYSDLVCLAVDQSSGKVKPFG